MRNTYIGGIILGMTAFAAWLNATFAGMDNAVSHFAFSLHESAAGGFFDWLFPFITLLGNGGIFFIAVAVVCLLFKKGRRTGATMLVALLLGLLVTNLALKNGIARPRPYADELSTFFTYWQAIGHGLENEIYSFPSGHATASFAAMTAVFLCGNKKYSFLAYVLALLIGFSRIYIQVHYASDIVGGALVGTLCGIGAWLLIRFWFRKMAASDKPACVFITNADIRNRLKKREV